jgi:hypothetical protein
MRLTKGQIDQLTISERMQYACMFHDKSFVLYLAQKTR